MIFEHGACLNIESILVPKQKTRPRAGAWEQLQRVVRGHWSEQGFVISRAFSSCVPATEVLGLSPEGSFQIHFSCKQLAKATEETYAGPCRYKDELTQNNGNMPS